MTRWGYGGRILDLNPERPHGGIDFLEYEYNTKETSLSDYKMILLKVKIPCDGNFSYSKVYYSILIIL